MIMRSIDDEIRLTHDTLLKCKDNDCRLPDENHRYTISGLTAEQMKTVWHSLAVYEGMLRDKQ